MAFQLLDFIEFFFSGSFIKCTTTAGGGNYSLFLSLSPVLYSHLNLSPEGWWTSLKVAPLVENILAERSFAQ